MPLNTYLKILLLVAVVLMSCNTNRQVRIVGTLIYSNGGNRINAIVFHRYGYDVSTLYRGKGISTINNITNIDDRSLVFDECSGGECSIKLYHNDSGEVTTLRSGRFPVYVPNQKKLFFYDEGNSGGLFMASMDDVKNAVKLSKEPSWLTHSSGIKQPLVMPIVQISDDNVVFVGKDNGLWVYHVSDSKLTAMGIDNCRPILWRRRSQQLLCADWNAWNIYLMNMSTRNKIDLPELNGGYGFIYIPSTDALIYGRTRSSFVFDEAYDIFFYNFADKKEQKIYKNAHLSAGIWIE